MVQSNARFNLTDLLEVHLGHVRVPAGNGRMTEKTKGRILNVLSAIKKSLLVLGSCTNNLLGRELIVTESTHHIEM